MVRRRLLMLVAAIVTLMAVVVPAGHAQSPNDHPIVFESDRDGDLEIYVLNPGGDALVQLTDNDVPDYDPAVSPDGQTIAFVSERDGEAALYRMAADGSLQTPIVDFSDEGPSITIAGPAWSPDGRIAFFTNRDTAGGGLGFAFNHEIYSVFDDGTDLVRLTFDTAADDGSPSYSPDGEHIVFASDRDGDFDLYRMDAGDGGDVTRLTENAALDSSPDWAPGGDKIAFWSDRSGDFDIHIITDVGAGGVNLTQSPATETNPAYTPDGSRIVYARDGDIWLMDFDGSGQEAIVPGPFADGDPDPAPFVSISHPVGLVDPDSGVWHLKDTTGSVGSFYYGNPGDTPFTGDWDCDGIDTPGLYRQSDGFVYLRNSNDAGVADVRFFFGNPGDIPILGDFDGDGCDTVSVYRPLTGQVFIVDELGTEAEGIGEADRSFYFGNPGDTPFTGDFDGDGIDTVGLYRQSTGLVYFRDSNTQGIADQSFLFGNPGDRFVTEDWTGTGTDSPGVFRPGQSAFYLKWVNAQGMADEWFPFYAEPDWIPIAGDFGLGS